MKKLTRAQRHKQIEKEANIFALLLLMPKKFIEVDLKNGLDLGDDNAAKVLCKKYGVGLNALTARLSLLVNQKI